MIIVNKEEFKTLLENNPGKKFAFVEWEPRIANSNLHITDGDIKYPLYGASTISYDPYEPDFVFGYDWNLLEYSAKDQFAILEENEIKELIEWLKEALNEEK
jgi:hypothetical protein